MGAKRRQRETNRREPRSAVPPGNESRDVTLLGVIGVLVVAIGFMACGEGGPAYRAVRTNAPDRLSGRVNPRAVIVRVGPYSITGARFNRFVSVERGSEPSAERLVPPDFSVCVSHLRAEATALGEGPRGSSQLRRECRTRYRTVAQAVLDRLISYEWLIGGAGEVGAPLGDREVEARLSRVRYDRLSGGAPSRRLLAERTPADLVFETRAKLALEAIRRALRDRGRPITPLQIAGYYALHKFDYLLTAERDLEIVRTATEASAAKVKAEIASGKSFATVVRKLSVRQPVDSDEGSVRELQPHAYGEPNLNQAIFTATPGVLVGPVSTWFGYFVFEVTKIRFEREKPLAEVQASIRRRLARPRQDQALTGFIKRWTATWTARTDCSPGYVVPGCRQFKGSPPPLPEGLSPLN